MSRNPLGTTGVIGTCPCRLSGLATGGDRDPPLVWEYESGAPALYVRSEGDLVFAFNRVLGVSAPSCNGSTIRPGAAMGLMVPVVIVAWGLWPFSCDVVVGTLKFHGKTV